MVTETWSGRSSTKICHFDMHSRHSVLLAGGRLQKAELETNWACYWSLIVLHSSHACLEDGATNDRKGSNSFTQ